jgi:hypothetical protein
MSQPTTRPGLPALPEGDFDYFDCFESAEPIGEVAEPAVWLKEAVAQTPGWIKNLRGRLLGTAEWVVLESTPGRVWEAQRTSIGLATVVAETVGGRRRMTTGVKFSRNSGRVLWAFVGIIHRRTARRAVSGRV